jgi:formamidopyrimidine-DNA glycosylase
VPELPEVEVLRRSLAPLLAGDRVTRAVVRAPALREPLDRARLARDVEGRRVEGLRRRAKYLLVDLERDRTLVLHLGMSGRITLAPADAPPEPHEHLAFLLASGRKLRLRDPRRFGLAFTLPTADLAEDRHFAGLGVEPVGPDSAGFSGAALARLAAGRRAPVKAFLMDARIVVGVGNIYASEALHRAGVHPLRAAGRISGARWEAVAAAVRGVLEDAIAQGGTTLTDFADGAGNPGYFQVSLAVYDRAGEPCPRCGTPVRRAVLAGRGTYYCPRCQR